MTLPPDHDARLERALVSLEGLSLGDALGERYFGAAPTARIRARTLPEPPWRTTDDTAMSLSVVEVLRAEGRVDRDRLALAYARRYREEPWRGYGGAAQRILQRIGAGEPWQVVSAEPFGGTGSMGNGGAMRVAPLGAYFADDVERAALEARASAEPTHQHPEGQAGAVAVAVAAAWAALPREQPFLEFVHAHTPGGATREGLRKALDLPKDASVKLAVSALGNGSRVISSDTVPFALWCAAGHLDDFAEAFWTTASGLGDRDTTCAIACGVVALRVGRAGIPAAWLDAREALAL
jgi:ADP-ribosylglycohydrolase